MTAGFTIIGSIASTTHKLINNVREHKGILSLNLKKLANRVDDLKIISILQNEMLLLMFCRKRVLKHREDIPRYGKTIKNSFLEQCVLTFSVKIAYSKIF